MGAFKAILLLALDIKTFLLSISFKLEKLASESLLRIASSQLYKTIIKKHPKPAQLRQLLPFENFTHQFEKKSGLRIANFKRTAPFIISLWWVPPKTTIALNKSEAKQNYNQMAYNLDPQCYLVVYTDGSGINDKIGVAAVIQSWKIVCKAFLGPSHYFTVYLSELQGIAMAFNIFFS